MLTQDLAVFFCGDLNPVASKAQKKVPLPDGLDLDAWINEPIKSESESSGDELVNENEVFVKSSGHNFSSSKHKYTVEPSPKEIERNREARLLQQQHDPNYLKPKTPTTPNRAFQEDEIPINTMEFDGVPPLLIPGLATANQYFDLNTSVEEDRSGRHGKKKKVKEKSKKKSKHRHEYDNEEIRDQVDKSEFPVIVNNAAEMPDGAAISDGDNEDDGKTGDEEDPHR